MNRNTMRAARALAVLVASAVLIAVLLGACGASGSADRIERYRSLEARCGDSTAYFLATDASGSSRSDRVTTERLGIIRDVVAEAAVCDGHVRVTAFSSSVTASVVLFDGKITLQGATANARARRLPKVVDSAMTTIEDRLGSSFDALPGDASDPLGQLAAVDEFARQLGTEHNVKAYLLTDGVSTSGVVLNTRALSSATALELGQRVAVPNLEGVHLTVAGIARVAGPPPPSDFATSLKVFFEEACRRAKAASCSVVSDYTSGS